MLQNQLIVKHMKEKDDNHTNPMDIDEDTVDIPDELVPLDIDEEEIIEDLPIAEELGGEPENKRKSKTDEEDRILKRRKFSSGTDFFSSEHSPTESDKDPSKGTKTLKF